MRARLQAGVLAVMWATPAWAGPTVVWLEATPPDATKVARVEKSTGAAAHFAYDDLAFPAAPWSHADEQEYAALRDRLTSARARWEEFDVEYTLASEIQGAIASIDVARDARDVDALTEALLQQGAAVHRAFSADGFISDDRAAPFRYAAGGDASSLNLPWVVGLAIDGDHRFSQGDAEASTWGDFQTAQQKIDALPDARLVVERLPRGGQLVVDGVAYDGSTLDIPVRPGRHFVHVLRDGQITGRSVIDAQPGVPTQLPVRLAEEELSEAKTAWLAEQPLPAPTEAALATVMASVDGPVFLAALDEGRVVVRAFGNGAALAEQRLVTGLTYGEFGPTLAISDLFDGSGSRDTLGFGVSNSIGFELGVSYAALIGGADVALTPGETVTFGNREQSANVVTSALPSAWGGLGAYAMRPIAGMPSLLIAGTFGWSGPAHLSAGGRLVFGIPSKADPSRWFRLSTGMSTSVVNLWDDGGASMTTGYLRIGVGHDI